ncbi:COMPASS (complex proteins associated with Set1p) component [Emydomyces testavorans]|uniref:COMPASS (Complex proteins associated with Set1p) component n=1 Tax=Emydomyces testavorans TaxID=2070801 RepID=A0AAF0DII3_9EURO|nr:COMPASS (complex proteins associated with Set1p) component [Emydomyces testavorans]
MEGRQQEMPATVQNNTLSEQPHTSASSQQFPVAPPSTTGSSQDGISPFQPAQSTQPDRDIIMGAPANRNNVPVADVNHVAAAATPQATPGGAPVRVYLNERLVPYLLEGMKDLAKNQPSNPLRVLGEYLLAKSLEIGEPSNEQSSST